jgi:hypothetical protein
MDIRWSVQRLEFSSGSGNHCSNMQRPALKLTVDPLRIFFHLQEAVTRKTWSIRFIIVQYFDLYFGIALYSVVLVFYFCFNLYSHVPVVGMRRYHYIHWILLYWWYIISLQHFIWYNDTIWITPSFASPTRTSKASFVLSYRGNHATQVSKGLLLT